MLLPGRLWASDIRLPQTVRSSITCSRRNDRRRPQRGTSATGKVPLTSTGPVVVLPAPFGPIILASA